MSSFFFFGTLLVPSVSLSPSHRSPHPFTRPHLASRAHAPLPCFLPFNYISQVLLRVLENDGTHLTFLPAVLEKGFTRVCVKGEDYPALISEKEAIQIGAR